MEDSVPPHRASDILQDAHPETRAGLQPWDLFPGLDLLPGSIHPGMVLVEETTVSVLLTMGPVSLKGLIEHLAVFSAESLSNASLTK